jgi:hypothetical protein
MDNLPLPFLRFILMPDPMIQNQALLLKSDKTVSNKFVPGNQEIFSD